MTEQVNAERPAQVADFPIVPAVLLTVAIFTCSIYANLSFAVTDAADFRYFPPFKPYVNWNTNQHLGGEAFNIHGALRRAAGGREGAVGRLGGRPASGVGGKASPRRFGRAAG